MIASLKPYPAMKDSSVPWLGEVPVHWGLDRAKWLFRKMDRPLRDRDEVVTCFRDGTVTLRKNRRTRGFTESLKEIGYQGIRRGDLVIHAMDAFAGAIGVADSDGKGTPVYSVCKPAAKVNAHYYAHTLREMARSQWIQALAKGVRERSTDFRFESFGSQLVPLPPFPEQDAIVRFLDSMDRRIRRYVQAKQKLIALLEEHKQAIIHRAVTRGLDPDVRLKPSGVEWLGDVPEHCHVLQVRRLTSFLTSGSRGWAQFYSAEGDTFIQSGNLGRSMNLDFRSIQHVRPPTGAEGQRTRVRRDDLLICITGALTGNVVHVADQPPEASFVNQHVALLRPNRGTVVPRYLAYALYSNLGQLQFKSGEYGGTKQGLGLDEVKSTLVPVPPIPEQRMICSELDEAMGRHALLTTAEQNEIALLREYRSRLIADVVTGKLDVREAAARLPEEVEEPPSGADELSDPEEVMLDNDTVPEEVEI